MSTRRLRIWVIGSATWFVVYASLYAYCDQTTSALAKALEALIPLAVAIPATALAAAFNRRNSYLQALRELWRSLIPAAQSAIQYTHMTAPDQAAFARTQEAMSTAIDLLRGVFANVPRRGAPTGLFPYENLKDIYRIVSWLGFGETFRTSAASDARACITKLWQEMHTAMLEEFDRDVPIIPVGRFLWDGRSIADLLIDGDLRREDLLRDRLASHPRAALPIARADLAKGVS